MSKYQYTERDVPAMLGRRGFLKVIGLHLATSLLFGRHVTLGVRSQIGFKNISFNDGIRNPRIHNINLLAMVGYKF